MVQWLSCSDDGRHVLDIIVSKLGRFVLAARDAFVFARVRISYRNPSLARFGRRFSSQSPSDVVHPRRRRAAGKKLCNCAVDLPGANLPAPDVCPRRTRRHPRQRVPLWARKACVAGIPRRETCRQSATCHHVRRWTGHAKKPPVFASNRAERSTVS
ncbi:hypothetical protein K474DRAFT_868475 [Panus rudis PR-1116 ss-1]|nr:hypothetical protein K474DRAFT_868475 [Panus rudis PR-1116 ss-1]